MYFGYICYKNSTHFFFSTAKNEQLATTHLDKETSCLDETFRHLGGGLPYLSLMDKSSQKSDRCTSTDTVPCSEISTASQSPEQQNQSTVTEKGIKTIFFFSSYRM